MFTVPSNSSRRLVVAISLVVYLLLCSFSATNYSHPQIASFPGASVNLNECNFGISVNVT